MKIYKKGTIVQGDYDINYIYLQDSIDLKKPLVSKQISKDVIVDFDADGNVFGIELFIRLKVFYG